MAVEVYELQDDDGQHSEREALKDDATREWAAMGTFSHNEAFLAIYDEVDQTIELAGNTLYLDKLQVESTGANTWRGVATYCSEEEKFQQQQENNNPDEPSEPQWDADTKGATHHITSSYEQRIFGDGGEQGRVWTEYSNAINARKTKTGWDVKGIDVVIPALEINATIIYPRNLITIDWVKDVARATGKTNSVAWRGFDPGELLFKGASIRTAKFATISVTYSFSASENIVAAHNVFVGAVGPITKKGHDYVWAEYTNAEVAHDGFVRVFPRVRYVFVDKIYREFDFAALGF